jgi:hypothetical protein
MSRSALTAYIPDMITLFEAQAARRLKVRESARRRSRDLGDR